MQAESTRGSGAAPLRHVGLVALEALLVAILVWVAAMTLAGATGADGIAGGANAGRTVASLDVVASGPGGAVTIAARPGDDGMWVHLSCHAADGVVVTQWAPVAADHRAAFDVDPSDPMTRRALACSAEEGYFSENGRWRVLASTGFTIGG
jgi:hypothetical protein